MPPDDEAPWTGRRPDPCPHHPFPHPGCLDCALVRWAEDGFVAIRAIVAECMRQTRP